MGWCIGTRFNNHYWTSLMTLHHNDKLLCYPHGNSKLNTWHLLYDCISKVFWQWLKITSFLSIVYVLEMFTFKIGIGGVAKQYKSLRKYDINMQINAAFTTPLIGITKLPTKCAAYSRTFRYIRVFFHTLSHNVSLVHNPAMLETFIHVVRHGDGH